MAPISKTFQYIHTYSTKVKNPPDGIFTHILFSSEIILIFSGLFLHRLYRLLKVNIKWIRVPTLILKSNYRTMREN